MKNLIDLRRLVSILILLEIALEVRSTKWVTKKVLDVSILILLEIALEVGSFGTFKRRSLSFNPYSAGNCSGSVALPYVYTTIPRFQSLFCWKLLWKQRFDAPPFGSPGVSILILLEIALEVLCKNQFHYYLRRVSILILLEIALEVENPETVQILS